MTMRSHVEDDALLDVLDGTASPEATRHAQDCGECARRLADARAGLALAVAAEAPEPSPLYWDAFRGRVAAAIDAEPDSRRQFGRFFAPALLAAAATVAVVSFSPRDRAPIVAAPAPVAASSAMPAVDDAGVDAVAAAVEDLGCSDVAACVASLTDEESRALAEALRAELTASGDL